MIRFNTMVSILISPAEGCRGFVILLDVTKELSREVSFGSEGSSSNDRAVNFRKPDFDLVEPTRIGRRVMEPNCRIGVEELKNTLGFVRAQVVGHDMNFSASSWLATIVRKKSTSSTPVCRSVVLPMTSPVRESSAAYSERVP